MKDNILITIYCTTGFGDHYASIVTAFNHYKNIQSLGYKPKILILKAHKYFPSKIPLSVIYDFSSFDTEIIELESYGKNIEDIKYLKGLEKIYESAQGQVWVQKKTWNLSAKQDLLKYCSNFQSISRYHIQNIEDEPLNGDPFFIDKIYENSKGLFNNKKDTIGVHFRGDDHIINSSLDSILEIERWAECLRQISKIIEGNNSKNIFLSSANKKICDFFNEKYGNVFTYNISKDNNVTTHNACEPTQDVDDIDSYIQKSIDTLSEMVCFSYCKEIYSFSLFPSNFLLYATLNNKIYTDWHSKKLKIVINNCN